MQLQEGSVCLSFGESPCDLCLGCHLLITDDMASPGLSPVPLSTRGLTMQGPLCHWPSYAHGDLPLDNYKLHHTSINNHFS